MAKKRLETKLCTSVGAESLAELARRAALALSLGSDLVELRVDRLTDGSQPRDLEAELSRVIRRAVITVRSRREGGSFGGNEAERLELLSQLARMGPAFVDIELATSKERKGWVKSLPKGVEKIISWHDFKGTPALERLRALSREAQGHGALAKVITTATGFDDNLKTLTVCGDDPGRAISFCMGELGAISRVVSMRLGAPIAYASLPDEVVAPGQLSISTMRRLRRMVA